GAATGCRRAAAGTRPTGAAAAWRRGAPPRRPPQVPRAPAARGGTPQPSRRAWTEAREPRGGPAPPGRRAARVLVRNLGHLPGAQLAQEAGRLLALEAAIAGLDREEEAVGGRERGARHVEEGV